MTDGTQPQYRDSMMEVFGTKDNSEKARVICEKTDTVLRRFNIPILVTEKYELSRRKNLGLPYQMQAIGPGDVGGQ